MSTTLIAIQGMEMALHERPEDWTLRLILAEAYEDAGNELRASYLRWSAVNHKRPEKHVVNKTSTRWYWWTDVYRGDYLCAIGEAFERMWHYYKKCHVPVSDYTIPYPNATLLESETSLATYLQHIGVLPCTKNA